MVGKGYLSRFRALLSGFESMHSRTLPLRFDATTIEDTQSIGTSTGTRSPLATSLSSSRLSGSIKANGTLRAGRTTGSTVLST